MRDAPSAARPAARRESQPIDAAAHATVRRRAQVLRRQLRLYPQRLRRPDRPAGIGQQRPSQQHHVGAAVGQDLGRMGRLGDHPDRAGGDAGLRCGSHRRTEPDSPDAATGSSARATPRPRSSRSGRPSRSPPAFARRATVSSMVRPPGIQSVQDSRTHSGRSAGHSARIASTVSIRKRDPPVQVAAIGVVAVVGDRRQEGMCPR